MKISTIAARGGGLLSGVSLLSGALFLTDAGRALLLSLGIMGGDDRTFGDRSRGGD